MSEAVKKKNSVLNPVFKPVSSPDFQVGADMRAINNYAGLLATMGLGEAEILARLRPGDRV